MKFSSAFVIAAIPYLLPFASAEEDAADAAGISRTKFTPTTLKAPFLEQFTDDWSSRWQPSHAKKDTKADDEEWAYVGEWAVEEPTLLKGIDGDKGLIAKNEAAHHAISAKFAKAIDPKGKDLVIQYEVKLHESLACGGAYMKVLKENAALHANEFSNASPYVIMFGPDKCGNTNKVHFIFNHKHPKTGEYEEKHFDDNITAHVEKGLSTLYTLHVKADQTFEILINGESEHKGSLMEDFTPSVEPLKEIDDADDKKPSDWIDEAKMADPEALKPEDWDETAPRQIIDEDATKPEDWLEDEPNMVPDPEAVKPEDWDDDEDGDWAPPLVPNPKCVEVSGCGPWEKPLIENPNFKGKWPVPFIDNPAYKGIWAPKKIANPAYYEDKTPADFEPMGGIGFELWTMQAGIMFDNIYIGHSRADADALKEQTWDIKYETEKKEQDATQPAADKAAAVEFEGTFSEDPVQYIRSKVGAFYLLAQQDPINAVKTLPEVAGGLGAVAVTIIALLVGALGAGAKSPAVQDAAKKAKVQAVEAKDKAAEAVATGAEKAQAEVNKRTTRSTAN